MLLDCKNTGMHSFFVCIYGGVLVTVNTVPGTSQQHTLQQVLRTRYKPVAVSRISQLLVTANP